MRRLHSGLPTLLLATALAAAVPDSLAQAEYADALEAYQAADYGRALQLLEPLAEGGHPRAQLLLGELYQYGTGVQHDSDRALYWYRKAAYQGLSRAQAALALLYEYGTGVAPDPIQALMWYRLATSTEPPGPYRSELMAAQTELEQRLRPEALDEVTDLVQSWHKHVRAFQEMLQEAEQNNAVAQREVAIMYANGQGAPQDPAKAATWYRRAADQGDALAQLHLGFLYEDGNGVPKNAQEAARWYRQAADQGEPGGHFHLGLLYYKGEGVPRDLAEAVRSFRQAAKQGDAPAQIALGRLYEQGEGVPRDLVQAYFWYGLVASGEAPPQYFAKVAEARKRLREHLSLADLSRALDLERDWRAARSKGE